MRKQTSLIQNKILTEAELLIKIDQWRLSGEKLVFTNGCFDILHAGHVLYLEKAKALGNRLLVGLNSDTSINQLKGPHRPIVNQDERSIVLAGLESIDAVMLFDELTPLNLIIKIKPDILVKGGDWSMDKIVGYDYVTSYNGHVTTIRYMDGLSTSNIENRIIERSKERS